MDIQDILNQLSADFFLENNEEDIQLLLADGSIDLQVLTNKFLGFKGVSALELKEKENILGCELPPSYKEFLLTSNGFRWPCSLLDRLLPTDKIDWAINTDEEWVWDQIAAEEQLGIPTSDEQYFTYNEDQDCVWWRPEYLEHSLKISDWYDGKCIFLNPIVKHDLEWEVLEHANWYPGTFRHKSFKDFLIAMHNGNLNSIKRTNSNCS